MNNNNIQEILLQEHNRDKKLTFYAFAFYAVIGVLVIIALFRMLLSNFTGTTPTYYKLIGPVIIIGFGIVVFKKIKALNTRHLLIEQLFNNLNNGKKASSITQYIDYKVILPLGRMKIKLLPVNFLTFSLANQQYILPVPVGIESDFKVLLSGVNINHVNTLKENLYNDSKIESSQPVALKSIAEFKDYANQELTPILEKMEKSRKKGLSFSIIAILFSLLVVVGFLVLNYTAVSNAANTTTETYGNSIFMYYIIGFGILFALIYLVYMPMMKKKYQQVGDSGENYTSFKERILKQMISFINPSFQYVEHGYIGKKELQEIAILKDKNYDITGNDQILGSHNGVPFQYCDLHITYMPSIRLEHQSAEEIFSGQFFMAKFNKTFNTQIVVSPKTGVSGFITSNSFSANIIQPSNKIMLEDPEFTKMFDVYADDQIEARYVLTPSTMQNIKDIAVKAKGNLFLFFTNNKIIVANNNRENKFETGVTTKLKPELLTSFYQDLYKQFSIIDDLKLNINIWKQ
ncbi:DUF3137 domain-containing protein [Flavobacterium endoglycinae]|uniref:DUF3137 domain-containing protein n=1 Tax=Flavobacterium endoglycinae TaxID=2816357 RepID=A0ABX7QH35_9FLAO|nr:DUF3137 domain-containing protein [Flavobacterium endoglycinae]QSW90390.1 DUF3137 domain-containing protein [Flavobacterium endoglycinae]